MGRKFSDEELNNIINDYNNGMIPKDLAEKYERDSGTIIGKLQSLGVYKNSKYRYTKDDIDFLKEYYPKGDFDSIFNRFPNATIQSIRTVCSKHGIRADYFGWLDKDEEIIKEYYYKKSLDELATMMGNRYTTGAIQSKALKLGYSKDRTWTDNELAILHKYYQIEVVDEVAKRLPKRTRQAIIRKANDLHIRSFFYSKTYWTDEDSKFLTENWQTKSDAELAKILGKDKRSILERRCYLGLSRIHHYNEACYKSIQKYIRGNIGEWKRLSMEQCNYKCVITGSKDFAIHHLYSFSSIFNEVFEDNGFELKSSLSDYTNEKLALILNKFIKKQSEYPLGVCVRKDIHKMFHDIYGTVVIPEMWYKFVNDINNDIISIEDKIYTN